MVLELLFKNQAGKNRKINLRNPKENLTASEAQTLLNTIADHDIFISDEGDSYAQVVGARYVSRIVEDIYMAE